MAIHQTDDCTISAQAVTFKGVSFIKDEANPKDYGSMIYELLLQGFADEVNSAVLTVNLGRIPTG